MILQGDLVKIIKGKYKGKFGRVCRYNPVFREYNIKIQLSEQEVNCNKNKIKKTNENYINKYYPKFKLINKNYILYDYNLKPSISILDNNPKFKGIFALGFYYPSNLYLDEFLTDNLSKSIIKLKDHKNKSLRIGEKLAEIFLEFIISSSLLRNIIKEIKALIAMPTQSWKNHVDYWGIPLSELLGKTYLSNELSVIKSMKYYKRDNPYQRKKKVKGAFAINFTRNQLQLIENQPCLILDDICTTGNQINELTNNLVNLGAKEVYAFVIGKTKD